jgi:hypothetical protein
MVVAPDRSVLVKRDAPHFVGIATFQRDGASHGLLGFGLPESSRSKANASTVER